jgi:hypothetical protein
MLVVLYYIIYVLEDLESELSYTLFFCYRGFGGLVVQYFAIDVIEDL